MGIVEEAGAILSKSEKQLEAVSINVANVSTPGFKKLIVVESGVVSDSSEDLRIVVDHSAATMVATGNALDIAVSGPGYFKIEKEGSVLYTRSGQFLLDESGVVKNSQGWRLASSTGGRVVLQGGDVEILSNGVFLQNGLPVARLELFEPVDNSNGLHSVAPGFFEAGEAGVRVSTSSSIHQGMIESSNVNIADETAQMMTLARAADIGARLVRVYDDLVGRSLTVFGGN